MTIAKPDNPLDRRIAIMELFDNAEVYGAVTVAGIAERVGGTPQGVMRALNDLGFDKSRRASKRRVKTGEGRKSKLVKIPAEWSRPSAWPQLYELHRRLRKMGMSASSAKRANVAVVPERYLEMAIGEVFLSNPEKDAIKHRGVYRKALNKVVSDGLLDVVSVRELAEVLGENNPAATTPAGLLNKAKGYMRVATRQELTDNSVTQKHF